MDALRRTPALLCCAAYRRALAAPRQPNAPVLPKMHRMKGMRSKASAGGMDIDFSDYNDGIDFGDHDVPMMEGDPTEKVLSPVPMNAVERFVLLPPAAGQLPLLLVLLRQRDAEG